MLTYVASREEYLNTIRRNQGILGPDKPVTAIDILLNPDKVMANEWWNVYSHWVQNDAQLAYANETGNYIDKVDDSTEEGRQYKEKWFKGFYNKITDINSALRSLLKQKTNVNWGKWNDFISEALYGIDYIGGAFGSLAKAVGIGKVVDIGSIEDVKNLHSINITPDKIHKITYLDIYKYLTMHGTYSDRFAQYAGIMAGFFSPTIIGKAVGAPFKILRAAGVLEKTPALTKILSMSLLGKKITEGTHRSLSIDIDTIAQSAAIKTDLFALIGHTTTKGLGVLGRGIIKALPPEQIAKLGAEATKIAEAVKGFTPTISRVSEQVSDAILYTLGMKAMGVTASASLIRGWNALKIAPISKEAEITLYNAIGSKFAFNIFAKGTGGIIGGGILASIHNKIEWAMGNPENQWDVGAVALMNGAISGAILPGLAYGVAKIQALARPIPELGIIGEKKFPEAIITVTNKLLKGESITDTTTYKDLLIHHLDKLTTFDIIFNKEKGVIELPKYKHHYINPASPLTYQLTTNIVKGFGEWDAKYPGGYKTYMDFIEDTFTTVSTRYIEDLIRIHKQYEASKTLIKDRKYPRMNIDNYLQGIDFSKYAVQFLDGIDPYFLKHLSKSLTSFITNIHSNIDKLDIPAPLKDNIIKHINSMEAGEIPVKKILYDMLMDETMPFNMKKIMTDITNHYLDKTMVVGQTLGPPALSEATAKLSESELMRVNFPSAQTDTIIRLMDVVEGKPVQDYSSATRNLIAYLINPMSKRVPVKYRNTILNNLTPEMMEELSEAFKIIFNGSIKRLTDKQTAMDIGSASDFKHLDLIKQYAGEDVYKRLALQTVTSYERYMKAGLAENIFAMFNKLATYEGEAQLPEYYKRGYSLAELSKAIYSSYLNDALEHLATDRIKATPEINNLITSTIKKAVNTGEPVEFDDAIKILKAIYSDANQLSWGEGIISKFREWMDNIKNKEYYKLFQKSTPVEMINDYNTLMMSRAGTTMLGKILQAIRRIPHGIASWQPIKWVLSNVVGLGLKGTGVLNNVDGAMQTLYSGYEMLISRYGIFNDIVKNLSKTEQAILMLSDPRYLKYTILEQISKYDDIAKQKIIDTINPKIIENIKQYKDLTAFTKEELQNLADTVSSLNSAVITEYLASRGRISIIRELIKDFPVSQQEALLNLIAFKDEIDDIARGFKLNINIIADEIAKVLDVLYKDEQITKLGFKKFEEDLKRIGSLSRMLYNKVSYEILNPNPTTVGYTSYRVGLMTKGEIKKETLEYFDDYFDAVTYMLELQSKHQIDIKQEDVLHLARLVLERIKKIATKITQRVAKVITLEDLSKELPDLAPMIKKIGKTTITEEDIAKQIRTGEFIPMEIKQYLPNMIIFDGVLSPKDVAVSQKLAPDLFKTKQIVDDDFMPGYMRKSIWDFSTPEGMSRYIKDINNLKELNILIGGKIIDATGLLQYRELLPKSTMELPPYSIESLMAGQFHWLRNYTSQVMESTILIQKYIYERFKDEITSVLKDQLGSDGKPLGEDIANELYDKTINSFNHILRNLASSTFGFRGKIDHWIDRGISSLFKQDDRTFITGAQKIAKQAFQEFQGKVAGAIITRYLGSPLQAGVDWFQSLMYLPGWAKERFPQHANAFTMAFDIPIQITKNKFKYIMKYPDYIKETIAKYDKGQSLNLAEKLIIDSIRYNTGIGKYIYDVSTVNEADPALSFFIRSNIDNSLSTIMATAEWVAKKIYKMKNVDLKEMIKNADKYEEIWNLARDANQYTNFAPNRIEIDPGAFGSKYLRLFTNLHYFASNFVLNAFQTALKNPAYFAYLAGLSYLLSGTYGIFGAPKTIIPGLGLIFNELPKEAVDAIEAVKDNPKLAPYYSQLMLDIQQNADKYIRNMSDWGRMHKFGIGGLFNLDISQKFSVANNLIYAMFPPVFEGYKEKHTSAGVISRFIDNIALKGTFEIGNTLVTTLYNAMAGNMDMNFNIYRDLLPLWHRRMYDTLTQIEKGERYTASGAILTKDLADDKQSLLTYAGLFSGAGYLPVTVSRALIQDIKALRITHQDRKREYATKWALAIKDGDINRALQVSAMAFEDGVVLSDRDREEALKRVTQEVFKVVR